MVENMLSQQADVDLMQQVADGDHHAFAEMVARHTDRFFALAFRTLQNRSDAEDVVQAAFIKLWQKPSSWQSDKSQFTTWFYRVVINACHDYRRKHKNEVDLDNGLFESLSVAIGSEQQKLEISQGIKQQQFLMEQAISRLPNSQRDALNLVVYSELPQKKVAEILGISLKAVESLLVRAKRSLSLSVQEIDHSELSHASTAIRNKRSNNIANALERGEISSWTIDKTIPK